MVSDLILDLEDVFTSLDVVLLFTCFPANFNAGLIMERWEEKKIFALFTKEYFEKALRFCLGNSYFKFRDRSLF